MTDTDALASPDTLRLSAPRALAAALHEARTHTLSLVDALVGALGAGLEVRYLPELNPPCWLLGELAWREDWWISRNPLRLQGPSPAGALAPRAAPPLPRWDACFAAELTHPQRWHQALPDLPTTLGLLHASRARTLALLAGTRHDDQALHLFRAILWHEDRLRERLLGLCQSLGVLPGSHGSAPTPCPATADELAVAAGSHMLGAPQDGFRAALDEPASPRTLDAFHIDRAPVTWARYLPFIEAGGYDDESWWDRSGWAWRQRQALARPRHLSQDDAGNWRLAQFGQWVPLDPQWPAMHLSRHEALAWCRWAGRRLPTAPEWEAAATQADFHWGQALEWTSNPWPEHPGEGQWLDEPWPQAGPGEPPLGELRGASHLSAPRLATRWTRQAASVGDTAWPAGFRSCAGQVPATPEPELASAPTAAPKRARSAPRKKPKADSVPDDSPALIAPPEQTPLALPPTDN